MDGLSDVDTDDISEAKLERQRERVLSVVETAMLSQALADEATEKMADNPEYMRTAMSMEAVAEQLEELYQVMVFVLIRMGGEPMSADEIIERSNVFDASDDTAEDDADVESFVGGATLDTDGEDAPDTPGFQ